MSTTKIIQYIHRPNQTELGQGNTHEKYLFVDAKTDMSTVFPPEESVSVYNSEKNTFYTLKSSIGNEFRINQLGSFYRDFNVMPGDEVIITQISSENGIKNYISVHNYNRVEINNNNGAEIVNIDRLAAFSNGNGSYALTIKENGEEKKMSIQFKEAKKKRADSPLTTDYYTVKLGDNPLANGKYYLNLDKIVTIIPKPQKSEFNQVILDNPPSTNSNLETSKNNQIIFYGAPGTGKSYEINQLTKGKEVIRTTFHPDSDYSTFVGAYKPTSIEVPVRDVTGKIIIENNIKVTENRIVYEFVEQAFLQAYIKAWKAYAAVKESGKPAEQYLIIEEINRGNCAQIFGDLFQLLDRNAYGFSDYPITADKDMKKQLAKTFKDVIIANPNAINAIYDKDVVGGVLNGDILLLPNNLYIWATMNTSDQSLFPIDSAFKRRWDWKYVPISEGKEKGIALGWKIKANGKLFDWWQFVNKINAEINEQTKSEDKKLGYFFCKAQDGIVSADKFVSKVIFYLWNDVFKDMAFDNDIFRDGEEELTFNSFYDVDADGKTIVKEDKVELFLKNLGIEIVTLPAVNEDSEEEDEDGNTLPSSDRNYDKFSVNGSGRFGKNKIATVSVKKYVEMNPNMPADEVIRNWKNLGINVPHFIESKDEYDSRTDNSKRSDEIQCGGTVIYVAHDGYGSNGKADELVEAINKQNWGINLAKIEA